MSSFEKLFPTTTDFIESSMPEVFPTCSVGVYYKNQKSFYFKNCSDNSLFDLASLTKVLCTTTCYSIFEEKRLISIDEPLQKYYLNFSSDQVKLSHLLDHSSGFPAWLDLHSAFHEPKSKGIFNPITTPALAKRKFEHEIIASWNTEDFEKKVTYSDLGFLLLGWILETKLKTPLDSLFQEAFANPYKKPSLQFLPLSPNIVPTETCPWRGHTLRGEVHDDNSYVLGGVTAHAGLFGNTLDVLDAAILWMKAYLGQTTFITPQTAHRYWTQKHIESSVRSLGWDGVSKEGSSSGHFFSSKSRGHLGYTGTSIWIDPEKELIVTLLTNRVHPTRTNEKIKIFRPQFHDHLLQELGFGK